MVTGANGNAQTVEQCAKIERVNVTHVKGHHSVLAGSGAKQVHALNGLHLLHGILCILFYIFLIP